MSRWAALLLSIVITLFVASVPPRAQEPTDVAYRIAIEKVFPSIRERGGKKSLHVTVQFKIRLPGQDRPVTNIDKREIIVEEDRRRVADLEIHAPRGEDRLTVVLGMDVSGSMTENNSPKLAEAKRSALTFFDRLHDRADCGLIFFNHEVQQPVEPPVRDPARFAEHRNHLRARVEAVTASGGTAYLDATAEAVKLLRGARGRRAVLVMTDGVDINSKRTLQETIDVALAGEVPVYTLGVGEPGKREPVSSVLVLDRSASMNPPANETDRLSKIEALKRAAARFVDVMRPGALTTLLPFSTTPSVPKAFTAEKSELKRDIDALRPDGGTALYDATFNALETLQAARRPGKRAVVVLTDGVDESPGSRHSVEDVIQLALETRTPLHLLGLGREDDIDVAVMKRMAKETHGTFYHARDQQSLLYIFEKLSIDLHDEGIDEDTLRQLAEKTGGRYIQAKDVSKLHEIYEQLADELQSTYTVTFPSTRPTHDGSARGIDIYVERGGKRASQVASADVYVRGVIVADMDHRVYLVLLAGLAVLLAVPGGIRGLYRFYGGT